MSDSEAPPINAAHLSEDGGPEPLPKLNHFYISAARHDRDRIELDFDFDGLVDEEDRGSKKFTYDVDVVLFAPKSLGLTEIDNVEQLRHEFQSYVRLQTHVSNPKLEMNLSRVMRRLERARERKTKKSLHTFAIEFESYMKARLKSLKKGILRNETPAQLQAQVKEELEGVSKLLIEFRNMLSERGLEGKSASHFSSDCIERDLLLANEYVSHVYVQNLGELHKASRQTQHQDLLPLIEKNSREEARIRRSYHYLLSGHKDELCENREDMYLRRIGSLKKYFHRSLFIAVSGTTSERKLYFPVYALSAALAASWAIAFTLYQQQRWGTDWGIGSISLLTAAVLAYVMKDIMKDQLRRYFFRKGTRWFPNFEKKLFVERFSQRRRLGLIQEFLRMSNSERLPDSLRKARYGHAHTGFLEEALGDDIVHYRKRVSLDLEQLGSRKEFPWGLREIVRYRFDRLTPSMEDSYKETQLLSPEGLPSAQRAHRVYHTYVAAWVRHRPTGWWRQSHGSATGQYGAAFKAFRVTLDKIGVVACEALPWQRDFGIPPPPEPI